MLKFIVRRVVWTIPVILLVVLMTFLMMRQIKGNPFRTTERAVPGVDSAEPGAEVPPRPALVHAVRLLREGRRHVRPRPVARPAESERERRDQGALPGFDEAGPVRDDLGDRARDPARASSRRSSRTRSPTTRRWPSSTPATPCRTSSISTMLIYFFAVKWRGWTGLPTNGIERLERLDPAVDRARPRTDDRLRAHRAGLDAGDPAAGLHPHGEGERPTLATGGRTARAPQLAHSRDHRRRSAARLPDHRLLHRRVDLRHPRHRPVLRDLGDRT